MTKDYLNNTITISCKSIQRLMMMNLKRTTKTISFSQINFIHFGFLNNMSAIIKTKNTELMQRIIDEIKTCFDPEIPVDIWELGLIYELDLNDENELKI